MNERIGKKIKLTSYEELLGVGNEESAVDVEINQIHGFVGHPFKVLDDQRMKELVESISELSSLFLRKKWRSKCMEKI